MTQTQPYALAVALDMARRGWKIFPLKPGRKVPAIIGWENAATGDPDRIRRWWNRPDHTADGIGIACGPSGLLVIDCDRPKPGDTPPPAECGLPSPKPHSLTRVRAHGRLDPCEPLPVQTAPHSAVLPSAGIRDGADALAATAEQAGEHLPIETFTVHTGSGGLHLYYRQPEPGLGNSQSRLAWHVDTRGRGGYVVAAGNRIGGRVYTITHDAPAAPLPAWIAQRLTRPRPTVATPAEVQTDRLGGYLAAVVDAEVQHVTGALPGEHNRALYLAALNLGRLVAGHALDQAAAYTALMAAEQTLAATCPKADHTDQQAHKTITSGFRSGAQRPRTITSGKTAA